MKTSKSSTKKLSRHTVIYHDVKKAFMNKFNAGKVTRIREDDAAHYFADVSFKENGKWRKESGHALLKSDIPEFVPESLK